MISGHSGNAWRLRRRASAHRLFKTIRHLCNGWCLEELRNAEFNLRNFEYMAEDMGSQERVSARAEEVIVNADPFDLEELGPVIGQRGFERRAWRYEFLASAVRKAQLGRQADTLHLAGRAFGDFADYEDLTRDFEIRDP